MRIAQITDLHARYHLPNTSRISCRRSRWVWALFRKALEVLKQEVHPDLLVISGDLVDVPFYAIEKRDPSILSLAREDYLELHRSLEESEIPYLAFWGNHDDEATFRSVFPLPSLAFSLQSSRAPHNLSFRFQTFPFDGEKEDHFPYRDLSRYPSPPPGTGPLIHLQHYVITPPLNESYPHTYQNAETIMEWNCSQKVTLSIGGHYHPGYPPVLHKGTLYATGAAFCEPPYPIHLYEHSTTESCQPFTMKTLKLEEMIDPALKLPAITWVFLPEQYASISAEIHAFGQDFFQRLHLPHGTNLGLVLPKEATEEECDRYWLEWTPIVKEKGYTLEGVYPPERKP